MKLIGAVLIVISSSFAGIFFSRRLKKRCESLERSISALNYLKTRICIFDTSMKKALRETEKSYGLYGIFSDAAENMEREGLLYAWRSAVIKYSSAAAFNDKDTAIISSVGDRLGVTDSQSQGQNIEAAAKLLKEQLNSAKEEYSQKGRLYRSCGLLLGLFFALLLL